MACFAVPAAEAIAVTIIKHHVAKKESLEVKTSEDHISLSTKLSWLSSLLWGGTILLIFEHVWHGEVVPWFPFLTAAANPADTAEMLHEISTVGVCMALLVTGVWGIMCGIVSLQEKKALKTAINEK
ncbi:MAG: hypothetical protein LKF79_06455 [Solobacterium sp.]|jgi:hypothetical protein|nr:hypothetical protein [Solobacterium sp.]MCH4222630.1 hypothetical protein [Solobacterium sp.]MCH4266265.1 hypothetical protein [Solobacterium sp.]